jgi:hypothetical protein
LFGCTLCETKQDSPAFCFCKRSCSVTIKVQGPLDDTAQGETVSFLIGSSVSATIKTHPLLVGYNMATMQNSHTADVGNGQAPETDVDHTERDDGSDTGVNAVD